MVENFSVFAVDVRSGDEPYEDITFSFSGETLGADSYCLWDCPEYQRRWPNLSLAEFIPLAVADQLKQWHRALAARGSHFEVVLPLEFYDDATICLLATRSDDQLVIRSFSSAMSGWMFDVSDFPTDLASYSHGPLLFFLAPIPTVDFAHFMADIRKEAARLGKTQA